MRPTYKKIQDRFTYFGQVKMKRGYFRSIGLNIRTKLMDAEKGAIKNKHGLGAGGEGV